MRKSFDFGYDKKAQYKNFLILHQVQTPDMIDEPFSVLEPTSENFGHDWVIDPNLLIVDQKIWEQQNNRSAAAKLMMGAAGVGGEKRTL